MAGDELVLADGERLRSAAATGGTIWTAPVIGTVKGTLVVTTGPATFTVTNFCETRSGVTRDNLTPAYDDIMLVQPMSAADLAQFCPDRSGAATASADARPSPSRPSPRCSPAAVSRG